MKNLATALTFAVLAIYPGIALAQASPMTTSGVTGKDGPILQKALEANAKGDCPADLMGPGLLTACHQQIATIQPMLTAKGKITRTEFVGAQQGPEGSAETWLVVYEHGAQLWGIFVGPDGKIAGMFSRDD